MSYPMYRIFRDCEGAYYIVKVSSLTGTMTDYRSEKDRECFHGPLAACLKWARDKMGELVTRQFINSVADEMELARFLRS